MKSLFLSWIHLRNIAATDSIGTGVLVFRIPFYSLRIIFVFYSRKEKRILLLKLVYLLSMRIEHGKMLDFWEMVYFIFKQIILLL
jgi:hypothetical protein